eukprot:gb/GFBE01023420.1/.p1 GENE.gb/GFBE01023420.1/~~gb/GFBE01023420.1/.p1  ORF type:complete len:308 (+),score=72.03 gb/GFBE01023420.1/:1-924(+)
MKAKGRGSLVRFDLPENVQEIQKPKGIEEDEVPADSLKGRPKAKKGIEEDPVVDGDKAKPPRLGFLKKGVDTKSLNGSNTAVAAVSWPLSPAPHGYAAGKSQEQPPTAPSERSRNSRLHDLTPAHLSTPTDEEVRFEVEDDSDAVRQQFTGSSRLHDLTPAHSAIPASWNLPSEEPAENLTTPKASGTSLRLHDLTPAQKSESSEPPATFEAFTEPRTRTSRLRSLTPPTKTESEKLQAKANDGDTSSDEEDIEPLQKILLRPRSNSWCCVSPTAQAAQLKLLQSRLEEGALLSPVAVGRRGRRSSA